MTALLSCKGIRALYLLMCCCSYAITTADSLDGIQSEECGIDINDEHLARQCLNLTGSNIKSPIVLESTIKEDFICQNQTPLYIFSCTLYSGDLIWYFNNETVTAFLPGDVVGQTVRISYPESAPLYNITAVLTQVETISTYNTLFCVSILTVQPFNEIVDELEVIPFTVSCQTFCRDDDRTAACQTRRYKVAAKPSQPREVTGSIQNISATDIDAVVTLNWIPPENQNETSIDYYNVTLFGSSINNTMLMHSLYSSKTFSYSSGVSGARYTMASIAAVDMCGQISEASQSVLNVMTSDTRQISNQNSCNQQPSMIGLGFTSTLAIVMTLLTIALGGILTYSIYRKSVPCPRSKKHKTKEDNTNERGGENMDVQGSDL